MHAFKCSVIYLQVEELLTKWTLQGLCCAQWSWLSSKEQFYLRKVHCTQQSMKSMHLSPVQISISLRIY